jgi:hypothetical protein
VKAGIDLARYRFVMRVSRITLGIGARVPSHGTAVWTALLCAGALALACTHEGGPPSDAAEAAARRGDVSALLDPTVDRAEIARRDLFYGVGGKAQAPPVDRPFSYRKRDESGMSSNIEAVDANGVRWDAKLGDEARTEVVASRLLWAVGYHQPPVYYVPRWTISDGPEPGAQEPARFRPETPAWKRQGEWKWQDNPFVDTRELHGLIVMMVLMNSWDLKTSNNAIYPPRPGTSTPQYVVKDLGETFGHSVRIFLGGNDDAEAFGQEGFVREVEGDRVRFHYDELILNAGVTRDVTVEDVRWICERLSALSDRQWEDAFRAGGYEAAEAAPFIARMKEKVAEGLALRAESTR